MRLFTLEGAVLWFGFWCWSMWTMVRGIEHHSPPFVFEVIYPEKRYLNVSPIAWHLRMILLVAVFYLQIVWHMPRLNDILCITIFLKYPEVFASFTTKEALRSWTLMIQRSISTKDLTYLHQPIYQTGVCKWLIITLWPHHHIPIKNMLWIKIQSWTVFNMPL